MSASLNQFLSSYKPDPVREQQPDAYDGNQDDLHTRLVKWFDDAERATREARELSERDRDYYDHIQWTADELKVLKTRGQPPITINKIHDKVELLCGLERKARTDPKAFPRTPTEEDRAEAATQALRYIDDDNNYPIIRSLVFNNLLVEGTGAVDHTLEDDGKGGADIRLEHVSWERLWWDPHSRALDFSDARLKGMVVWMDREQVLETYRTAGETIELTFNAPVYGSYDDRPAWIDTSRERMRVVQCHWVENDVWWTATYGKGGILAEPQRSKFKDRRGKSACGLRMQSAYINRDNWRYGAVRGWISLQDEINKRRSKALHLLSVHQVIAEQGSVADVDKARREMAKPDGFVEITPGMKYEVLPGGELAAGQFQLLQHATAEMQLSGPNAAMSGTDPRELSGRAILAQQAGGAVQNEPLADALRMFSRGNYEMWWMAAREMWTGGKWVRVTDALNDTKWVGINRQMTLRDILAEMPEEKRAMVMQRMQPPLQPGDPRLTTVMKVQNDITDLDVDITVEEGSNLPTMEAENFQTLIQLAGMQPGLIPGDVLIAASSLRNKDELLQRMKAHMDAQQAKEQQAAPLIQRHQEATVAGLEAKAAADAALAKERNINAVRGVHDVHAEFTAPPYGMPHMAADAPSAPGTVGPAPMVPHVSGGLVTRVLPDPSEAPGWHEQLPLYKPIDPNFRYIDPNSLTSDNIRITYPDDQVSETAPGHSFMRPPGFVEAPMSHAMGGPINALMAPGGVAMTGGDPPGPDDGMITAKEGEYVLNKGAVARYGQPLLDAINAGEIDPKVLALSVAHSMADLRVKQAKALKDEAAALHEPHKTINTMAATHQIHHEITHPEPKPGASK